MSTKRRRLVNAVLIATKFACVVVTGVVGTFKDYRYTWWAGRLTTRTSHNSISTKPTVLTCVALADCLSNTNGIENGILRTLEA